MKPYGRKPAPRFPGKEDFHPKKGWRNWWEDMCSALPRCGIKQHWKREINEELNNKKHETI